MDTGNTAWILVCSALVLLMTPGLAFFYGGLVREKQVINTIKMSFIALGLITVTWATVGYSLAFAPGTALIGGTSWFGLEGVTAEAADGESLSPLAFMTFQMMFAIITPALISGAVVGRMKFRAYALFIVAWSLLVYCPLAHWVWGPGGWIAGMGALDFAGGTVVHVSAGVSALVAAVVLGPRRGEGAEKPTSDDPHNVPFVILGASLLWFGWFGFNAGSALAADGLAVLAFVTTMLAAAAAVVTWVGIEMIRANKPSATGAAIAAVVGLVAITPAAGFVTPMAAMAIGAAGAAASYVAMAVLKRTRLDDTLDVFACHGVGGIVGSVLTGVFATTAVNAGGADGLLHGNPSLLGVQVVSVVAAAAFAAVGTVGILAVVRVLTGLRTSAGAERIGIDLIEHAERAYKRDTATFNVGAGS
ncbi:MAG: ammonium transporter [Planctomycetota bacterium]